MFTRGDWFSVLKGMLWRHKRSGRPRLRRVSVLRFKIRFALGRVVAFSCFLVFSKAEVWLPPLLFNVSPNFYFVMILLCMKISQVKQVGL